MSVLTQQAARVEGTWRPRLALAALVHLIAYGLPLASASTAAWLVSRELAGSRHHLLATGTVLGAAVVVSLLVSRLTMKLMPLAVLLRMTMIFPDRAPSRVQVARLSTSAIDIGTRLHSSSTDESDAAMTMLSLVTALGRHDRRTRGHSERVRLFCDLLADELKLTEADAGRLRWAALIHDIGKLEIPERILNKPAGLSEEEWTLVRRHPLDGARLAQPLERWLGPWFAGIAQHHERWDGTGYPLGLGGEQISAAGRAIAVVDAFETMTSARAYKSARSTVTARTELAMCAGSHFDPAMVRAFLGISLPKLLWSVGPLAFLINVPYLRWAVQGGVRTAEAATAATAATANAAGATVVAVAVGAMPSSAASTVPGSAVAGGRAASVPAASAHGAASSQGTASGTVVASGQVAGRQNGSSAPLATFTATGAPSLPAQLPTTAPTGSADPVGPLDPADLGRQLDELDPGQQGAGVPASTVPDQRSSGTGSSGKGKLSVPRLVKPGATSGSSGGGKLSVPHLAKPGATSGSSGGGKLSVPHLAKPGATSGSSGAGELSVPRLLRPGKITGPAGSSASVSPSGTDSGWPALGSSTSGRGSSPGR